ncbi:MAG: choice-of-anchor tandem repeat GloVer-containing protein [Candidatus Sulfotelmatobacter sp.]
MTNLNAGKMAGAVLLLCAAAIAHAQTFTTLVNFDGVNGSGPYLGSLIQGSDGSFFGTTFSGGANDSGMVFRITPWGTVSTVYNFCSEPGCADGAYPTAGLAIATDGNLYGTASYGANGYGTIFKLDSQGKLTTLHSFNGSDGLGPDGTLIQAIDGNFYGTTYGGGLYTYGTVFKITPGCVDDPA